MKEFSEYLKRTIPTLEKLVHTLEKKYKYVSVLGADSVGKVYQVMANRTAIRDNMFFERGFVLRVHNGNNYAEYSFNEIDEDSIKDIVNKVEKKLELSNRFKKSDVIELNEYKLLQEEKIEKDFKRVYKGKEMKPQYIVERLGNLVKSIMAKEAVVNAVGGFQGLNVSKVFISGNKKLTQFYSWFVATQYIITFKDGVGQSFYDGQSGADPYEVFDKMEKLTDEVYKNAFDLLSSTPIKPGVYDCIVAPDITGLIAHEAFGHGVEMDMFVKGRALGAEYIGKRVASDQVTLHEAAKGNEEVSSYFFDDEGTLAHDTIEIKNGILQTGVCDAISALVLGIEPTGNGKRESLERKVYTRMTSTYFEPGNDTLEDMIKSIDYGFYITGMYSGMEDPKNWGIQCAAILGREIKDGKFTGKVVSPVMLTGYVPDLLGSISMRTSNLELFGSGTCGKGYKEWVKTADGGPAMKVRVNIG